MSQVSFFVHCEPVPQPRAKVSTRGGFARAYIDANHPSISLKDAIRDSVRGCKRLEGPIACELEFFFERPKSHTKKQRMNDWHTGRGDIDNLQKLVFDALNKIAYEDDKQIVSVMAIKRWVEFPAHSRYRREVLDIGVVSCIPFPNSVP